LAASYLVLVCGGDLARSEGRELLEFEAIASKPTGDHRGFEASLAWLLERHWRQLSPEQQGFLGRLCVYRVPIDRELAAGMLDGVTLDEARLALVALGDRSLLRRLEDGRYRVEPLVARYVAGLGLEAAHDRAIAVFEGRKLPREAWKLEGDIADYVELVFHYVQVGDLKRAFYTVRADRLSENCLELWLTRQGYRQKIIQIYEEILNAWQGKIEKCFVAMLTSMAQAHLNLEQTKKAIRLYENALTASRQQDDRYGEAVSLGGLGNVYLRLGKLEVSVENFFESLKVAQEIENQEIEASALGSLGNICQALGQTKAAISFFSQSRNIAKKIKNREIEASSLGSLGTAYLRLRKDDYAIKLLWKHNEIAREIRDKQSEATSLINLGNAYHRQGQVSNAIKYFLKALKINQAINNRGGEANTHGNLGLAYRSLRKSDLARQHFQAARKLFQTLQQPHFVKMCDDNLAKLDSPQKSDFVEKSDFFARLRQLWRRFRQFIRRLLS
jgi:tetratricopeptide (TPR) repeat protein